MLKFLAKVICRARFQSLQGEDIFYQAVKKSMDWWIYFYFIKKKGACGCFIWSYIHFKNNSLTKYRLTPTVILL